MLTASGQSFFQLPFRFIQPSDINAFPDLAFFFSIRLEYSFTPTLVRQQRSSFNTATYPRASSAHCRPWLPRLSRKLILKRCGCRPHNLPTSPTPTFSPRVTPFSCYFVLRHVITFPDIWNTRDTILKIVKNEVGKSSSQDALYDSTGRGN